MLSLFIPVIVIIATIAFAIWRSTRTNRRIEARYQWTFQFIQSARQLLEHLPQHRGMANAFLRGDESFHEKLITQQETIEDDFVALAHTVNHPLCTYEMAHLTSLRKHWTAIRDQVFQMSPEDSFTKHSLLISRLLDQIEDTCELASLYGYGDDARLLIKALASDLPRLTESLGQARGLGAGVAAQAQCSVAEELKLKFLLEKCSHVFDDTITPLLNSNNKLISSQRGVLQSCLNNGKAFIATIESEIIGKKHIQIESARYYADATQAIEESFKLFDSLLSSVQKT